MNGAIALIKGTPESSLPLLTCEDTPQKSAVGTQEGSLHQHPTTEHPDPALPASGTVGRKTVLLKHPQSMVLCYSSLY